MSAMTGVSIVWPAVLFRRRSNKTPKLRVTGLCLGNPPVTARFPSQRSSNAENISIWWHHHTRLWFWLIVKVINNFIHFLIIWNDVVIKLQKNKISAQPLSYVLHIRNLDHHLHLNMKKKSRNVITIVIKSVCIHTCYTSRSYLTGASVTNAKKLLRKSF